MQYFSRMVECPPRNVRNSSSSWAFGQLHDILSIGCHSVPEIYIFARRTHYNYADTLTSLVVGPYDSHCMVQFFFFLWGNCNNSVRPSADDTEIADRHSVANTHPASLLCRCRGEIRNGRVTDTDAGAKRPCGHYPNSSDRSDNKQGGLPRQSALTHRERENGNSTRRSCVPRRWR